MRVLFACDVPYAARIGENTEFPHHALDVDPPPRRDRSGVPYRAWG